MVAASCCTLPRIACHGGQVKMHQHSISDALASFEGRAYVEACRWWIWCDAGFVSELKGNGKLDRHLVRRICNVYQVSRTIRVQKVPHPEGQTRRNGKIKQVLVDGDPYAQFFADKLNGFADDMPAGLLATAEKLSKTISEIAQTIGTQPISASTKVLWFLQPDGWTMFDRWAATGVLGEHKNTTECMESFYVALARRGFEERLQNLKKALQGACFGERLAERVIDKYLFLVGLSLEQNKQAAKAGEELPGDVADVKAQEGFLLALPDDLRKSIVEVASKLAEAAPLESLRFKPKQKRTAT